MRSWIKVLAVVLICLVAIGFYRGWFSVSSSHSEPDGRKVDVDLTVDKGKMKSDIRKAERKVGKEVKEVEGELKPKEAAK
jgi:hypothetical protein